MTELLKRDAPEVKRDAPQSSDTNLPYSLPLELTVSDRETIEQLCAFEDGSAREEYALSALRIGVLALKQAAGEIDAEAVKREADRMLGDLRRQLGEHSLEVRTGREMARTNQLLEQVALVSNHPELGRQR